MTDFPIRTAGRDEGHAELIALLGYDKSNLSLANGAWAAPAFGIAKSRWCE